MAHSCPNCDSQCYCDGDIDDCLIDRDEDVKSCTHCLGREDEGEDAELEAQQ